MPYAEVAVDAPIRDGRTFSYSIPSQLAVDCGQMVQVPFGPRMVDGVVFQVTEAPQFSPVRPIEAVDPLGPLLSSVQLDLARWISQHYMTSLFAAAALMLPPGFRSRTRAFINLAEDVTPATSVPASAAHSRSRSQESLPDSATPQSSSDPQWERVLALLRKHRRARMPEEALRRALGSEAERAIDRLVRRGFLVRSWVWRAPRGIPRPQGDTAASQPGEAPLAPTPHQARAIQELHTALAAKTEAAFLLQGVTGSGKTEVYLQALARCLEQGRTGIVLVPEISLTPQAIQRFQARFPGRVAVLHSGLSAAEHRRTWWALRHGAYDVVVGPRSALFAPLERPGLIIIDEEHEWTYKQQDADPRYHARTVSLYLAQLTGSVVVLGSATPDVVSYHRALSGRRLRLLELPHRIGERAAPRPLAKVEIVDMRRELKEGNRSIFSRALQQALLSTISRGEQAILFINRRGAAGIVQCRDCGHVLRCRSCDIPLTYHTAPERLLCHQCNRHSSVPQRCPNCRGHRIRYLGLGTQRVVQELERLAPGVATLRWDRDVASSGQAQETVLERFARGEAQVLVGTQMVAKGLHISAVTLVGVVLADIGLQLPDFRAPERIFQLLCQVAGRAGRGAGLGTAIVQTYLPDQYAVAAAATQDYPAFYRQEIDFRRIQRLPPFSRLIRLLYAHTNAGRCEREAQRLARALRHQREVWGLAEVDLLGPAPAYPARVRGRYRWHLLLRGNDPRLLLDKVELPQGWTVDVDPVSVL